MSVVLSSTPTGFLVQSFELFSVLDLQARHAMAAQACRSHLFISLSVPKTPFFLCPAPFVGVQYHKFYQSENGFASVEMSF